METFDASQRRERFWSSVIRQGGATEQQQAQRASQRLFHSKPWSALVLANTLFALFAPCAALLGTNASTDADFGIAYFVSAAFFLLDYAIHLVVSPGHWASLAGLLDIVSIAAMAAEASMFVTDGHSIFGNYITSFVDTWGSKNSMLKGESLSDVVTIIRCIRICILGRLARFTELIGESLAKAKAAEHLRFIDEVLHRRLKMMFACMDEDSDGRISQKDLQQFLAYLKKLFAISEVGHAPEQTRQNNIVDRKSSAVSVKSDSDVTVNLGDFCAHVKSSPMAKKLAERIADSLQGDSRTLAMFINICKNTISQILVAIIAFLIFTVFMVKPLPSSYGAGTIRARLEGADANVLGRNSQYFLSVTRIDPKTGSVSTGGLDSISPHLQRFINWGPRYYARFAGFYLKITLAAALCGGVQDIRYMDVDNYNDFWRDLEIILPLGELQKRSFETEFVRSGLGTKSFAVVDLTCALEIEYRGGLWLSLAAVILLLVASVNFLSLFGYLTSKLLSPLKGLNDQLEQLGVFEATIATSTTADKVSEDELDEVKNVMTAILNVQKMVGAWGKYVPYDVVQMVIFSGEEVQLGVKSRDVTVLFSDIESFTTICEKISPQVVLSVLSTYFAIASEVISGFNGTLLEFIGDGLLVCWNAPATVQNHSLKAIQACVEMQNRCRLLSENDGNWTEALRLVGKTHLRVRMGVHTGQLLCGNIGASNRMKYGMLGDVVNTASRLEELNKRYQTSIIVSEAVVEAARVKKTFLTRVIDRVAVKGKDQGLTLYEVLGYVDGAAEYQLTLKELHAEAFTLYLRGRFVEAAELLKRAEAICTAAQVSPRASNVLLSQALYFSENPPPTVDGKLVFDGTTRMQNKDGS
jgi:class 3 adenylate cyclase